MGQNRDRKLFRCGTLGHGRGDGGRRADLRPPALRDDESAHQLVAKAGRYAPAPGAGPDVVLLTAHIVEIWIFGAVMYGPAQMSGTGWVTGQVTHGLPDYVYFSAVVLFHAGAR